MSKLKRFLIALKNESAKRLAPILVILAILLLVQGYHNSRLAAQNTSAIRASQKTSQQILKKQNDLLESIRQVSIDGKLTAQQQTDIIICMLQVPQTQRTTDIKEKCRQQIEQITADNTTITRDGVTTPKPAAPVASTSTSSSSSTVSQPTTTTTPVTQPTNSGDALDQLPVVGGVLKSLGL